MLPQLLQDQRTALPHVVACRVQSEDGWQDLDFATIADRVDRAAHGLQRAGFRPGDRLAVCCSTRIEWFLAELAALTVGGSVVGIDPHAGSDAAAFILGHSDAVALVAENEKSLSLFPADAVQKLKFTVVVEANGASTNPVVPWNELLNAEADGDGFAPLDEDAPATLIYTSGTTGRPKGIEFTHRQITTGCTAIGDAYPELTAGDSTLCWLPMSHLFQRMMNYVALSRGVSTAFVNDPRKIMQAIQEVRPHVFVGVPRFYEKLHEGIAGRIGKLPRPVRKLVQTARRLNRRAKEKRSLPARWMDRLVLARIRQAMGGRIRFMITGSAPASRELLEFFDSVGLPLLEAYGLSENTVPIAANRYCDERHGSVGKPFPENTLRLAGDGEVLVKGAGLFAGYYKEVDGKERFTEDGCLKTGDLGRFDDDGFLYLSGRKSEMIKTSTGRRIAPAGIEAVYAGSPFIEQVVIVGDGRKHLAALVTVSCEALQSKLGADVEPDAVADSPAVREIVSAEFQRLGAALSEHERPTRFAVLPRAFSISKGELTPTLKLRRRAIVENFSDVVDGLFAEDGER